MPRYLCCVFEDGYSNFLIYDGCYANDMAWRDSTPYLYIVLNYNNDVLCNFSLFTKLQWSFTRRVRFFVPLFNVILEFTSP